MSLDFFFTFVVVPRASDFVSTLVEALPTGVFVSTVVELASSAKHTGIATKEIRPSEIESVLKDRNMISSIAAVSLQFHPASNWTTERCPSGSLVNGYSEKFLPRPFKHARLNRTLENLRCLYAFMGTIADLSDLDCEA